MIEVTYRFPAGINPEKQAQMIAIGQTVGSWGAQFSHRAEAMKKHTAEVLAIKIHDDKSSVARIGFPRINTENDIGSLLTMIFGKFSLAGPARITAIKLPADYGIRPKFGINGIREKLQLFNRPLVMGIFKPALGLTAGDHAQLLDEVAAAGLYIIKDD